MNAANLQTSNFKTPPNVMKNKIFSAFEAIKDCVGETKTVEIVETYIKRTKFYITAKDSTNKMRDQMKFEADNLLKLLT